MEDTNLPLVSVPVITYNSAKTVIETLDSIYNQTYPNIELIISDDCSKDNTVELCQQWLESHKDRFARTEILTVEKNTGISANCNRASSICKGDWMKNIAGDDVMLPNCIQNCMDYVTINTDVFCLFGKMDVFGGDECSNKELREIFSVRIDAMMRMTPDELYSTILHGSTPPAPTFFCKVGFLEKMGAIVDERIPLINDMPQWLNILKRGIKIGFLDKEIVRYRLGGISTSDEWASENVYRNKRLLYFYYQHDEFVKEKGDKAIEDIVDVECEIYREMLKAKQEVSSLRKYWPVRIIRKFRKICKLSNL